MGASEDKVLVYDLAYTRWSDKSVSFVSLFLHRFAGIIIIKFLLLTGHFLAATLDFTSFLQWPSWGPRTFFTAWLFLD